jgi:hypothetical protein
MEAFIVIVAFLLCIALPIALVVALIVWLARRSAKPAAVAPLPVAPSPEARLRQLERRLCGGDVWRGGSARLIWHWRCGRRLLGRPFLRN